MAGRAFMLVRGKRVPIVGSVCMDMTMIDVTGLEVHPGDEVVIVGAQGTAEIGMREIAASIGTIPYELLCRVGTRIERQYGSREASESLTGDRENGRPGEQGVNDEAPSHPG